MAWRKRRMRAKARSLDTPSVGAMVQSGSRPASLGMARAGRRRLARQAGELEATALCQAWPASEPGYARPVLPYRAPPWNLQARRCTSRHPPTHRNRS